MTTVAMSTGHAGSPAENVMAPCCSPAPRSPPPPSAGSLPAAVRTGTTASTSRPSRRRASLPPSTSASPSSTDFGCTGRPAGAPVVNQTVQMASFADVENVEPDLADRVRAILSSTTNAVLGTIRRDGSPRLSGADPYFHDGQLRIWSMPRARKGQDLRRDPRVAVHSIPWDSRKLRDGAADVGQADAKVSGTAVLTSDAGDLSGVSRVVEVRAWPRAAGGLGSVHDRHRRAHGHLGRRWPARGRPVVDDRRSPDDAPRVAARPRRDGFVTQGAHAGRGLVMSVVPSGWRQSQIRDCRHPDWPDGGCEATTTRWVGRDRVRCRPRGDRPRSG